MKKKPGMIKYREEHRIYWERMMKEFDEQVKRLFTGESKKITVQLRGIKDDPNEGIIDGTILLSGYKIWYPVGYNARR